ncbi:cell division protein FtsW [Neomicrococcus aestuarii]|uniref:Probable peptidoglycan glycosyltransferase FtsW n=1 Tax=Neomicrococcus aestuarii TaxID=556325 RepID=A0A7W8X2C6_9MICC|nr:putative lipid II flippase FtsW [Neomicrococcus aestuarii]MBB5513754.1 cell division protein FtsW [Neomicrococcus aestuarii]
MAIDASAPTGAAQKSPRNGSNRGRNTFMDRFWKRIDGNPSQGSGPLYYVILGVTLALTVIGLVMVLSSSSVEAITEEDSSYALFLRQGLFAALGVVGMLALSRFPVAAFRKMSWILLVLAVGLLGLVFTPLGVEVYGNRNWIKIGSFTGQPSEAAKLALAIWGAHVLAMKGALAHRTLHAIVPVVFPGGALLIGLVLLGQDLGTAIILGLILTALLFLGGANMKLFGITGLVAIVGAIAMVLLSGNRVGRINAWLRIDCDTNSACDQPLAGLQALASGSWFGVGLGQSRQKWKYIPEAHNDFIFSILGEELGLFGSLVVIVLFGALAVAMYRVAARAKDPFVRIATGGIMVWVVGQAFVNIGMVTGLLPVIGVPLPFISYGGTALFMVLLAVGVVMAFARDSHNDSIGATSKAAVASKRGK